ncbi:phosphoribosyltransferase [Persephonella atlantica]|uniref:Phosphoribosyltransferase n=1 Tax=Persephonella atlantica TaxID=2699429 RepID=A0ABS1GID8_9AQUI|nr:phosphoribosyltransferase family protein [Persephonella atlantica]MBK3332677.1 phosphoribosyltransferase [Persephonella atlantica]
MGRFVEDKKLHGKSFVFKDREDAGDKIADFIQKYIDKNSIILAVPSGGIPVAYRMSKKLHIPFDLVLVKKITYPWTTEAGFGAVSVEGDEVINSEAVEYYRLSEEEIKKQKEKTVQILKERNRKFRRGKPFPDIKGKTVVVVDDGLASGSTMKAAIEMITRKKPEKIIVAVPTCSHSAVKTLLPETDMIVCLNYRPDYPYAVADAYENWYDLTDEDVLYYLEKKEGNDD